MDIAGALIDHFKAIFNAPSPVHENSYSIPVVNMVPSHLLDSLVAPVTNQEIKAVVLAGVSSSAPGPMPKGAKATAITLIPKGTHSSILDFKLISLCIVLYKVAAKIIANRLKTVLPSIIHESQFGFIANRCFTDNIILASELLKVFKGSHKLFCAKLDIKKTFDSVSRVFLLNILRQ